MNLLIICILVIAFIFVIHFIGLQISNYIRKKYNYQSFRYYKRGYRYEFGFIKYTNMIIEYMHKTNNSISIYNYDYAKSIMIQYAGLCFVYKWGHKGIDAEYNRNLTYGLFSMNNKKWWDTICFGKHMYDNPFMPMYFTGCYYYNNADGKLIKRTNHFDFEEIPFIKIDNNTFYNSSDGVKQSVNRIRWYIEERRWEVAALHYIGLGKLFRKISVDLTFDSDTGLGAQRDTWKGGVFGASINLNNDHKKVYELYKEALKYRGIEIQMFKQQIDGIIDNFMYHECKY
jgi:hypothetical protein